MYYSSVVFFSCHHVRLFQCTPVLSRLLSAITLSSTQTDGAQEQDADNPSLALVIATLPLIRTSALTYSGTLGYLVGCIHRAISPRPPVFTVQSRARRKQLAAWSPSEVAAEHDVLVGLECLLSALPQLYINPNDHLHYGQYLTQFPTDDPYTSVRPQEPAAVHYHQLLCASVLTDAYLFLTEGVLAR